MAKIILINIKKVKQRDKLLTQSSFLVTIKRSEIIKLKEDRVKKENTRYGQKYVDKLDLCLSVSSLNCFSSLRAGNPIKSYRLPLIVRRQTQW